MGQTGSSTTTTTLTTVSSSASPCLSPIRYTFDTSQTDESQANEAAATTNTDDGQNNQLSLPADDSSLKVRTKQRRKKLRVMY